MQRALARRRRYAAAHLSVTASPCHLSSRRGFRAALPERCHRTKGLPRTYGSIFEAFRYRSSSEKTQPQYFCI